MSGMCVDHGKENYVLPTEDGYTDRSWGELALGELFSKRLCIASKYTKCVHNGVEHRAKSGENSDCANIVHSRGHRKRCG